MTYLTPESIDYRNVTEIWPDQTTEIIPIGSNYDAWSIEPIQDISILSWNEAVEHLIGWGILAPSAHNKQHWVVHLSESEHSFQVFPEEDEIGVPSDLKGREAHISIGCFAQNVILAKHAYGIEPNYNFIQQIINGKNICGIEFKLTDDKLIGAQLQNIDLLNLMKTRRVYRGSFDESYRPENKFFEELLKCSVGTGIETTFITDKRTRNSLGKIQALANSAVLLLKPFRQELAHHLVPNDTTETRVMPGNNFGLGDDDSIKVHEALLSGGKFPGHFAAGFAKSAKTAFENAFAVGILSAENDESFSWIESGMVLEKIWLHSQANGYGVWPMAGMIESPLHRISLDNKIESRKPINVFVVGKPKELTWPHSPRERSTIVYKD